MLIVTDRGLRVGGVAAQRQGGDEDGNGNPAVGAVADQALADDRSEARRAEAGYAPVSPGWPDDPDTVAEANANPDVFAGKTVGAVADHYSQVIGTLTGHKIILGIQNAQMVLLLLTLFVSAITFTSGRTNILQGLVHVLLFLAYIVLLFQG